MGFGKDGKGVIIYHNDESVLGGALGAGNAGVIPMDPGTSIEEDFRLLKLQGCFHVANLAAGELVIIGIADGELTATEIQEALQASPVDSNDNLNNERAQRPVFPLAYLSGDEPSKMVDLEASVRWTFSDNEFVQWFVFNPSDTAAHAGALTVISFAKLFGVWVK